MKKRQSGENESSGFMAFKITGTQQYEAHLPHISKETSGFTHLHPIQHFKKYILQVQHAFALQGPQALHTSETKG